MTEILRPTGWNVCVAPQDGVSACNAALGLLSPGVFQAYGLWQAIAGPRIPVIYSDQLFDRAAVRSWLETCGPATWMLPNEPELPEQANMTVAQGVDLTLEFIDLARSVGNRFQWCAPSVTMTAAGRAWLTEYASIMRQYKGIHRPAYWCIHPYPSGNLAKSRQSWAAWRSWAATWAAGAPVVISEVCAENSPLADQVAVMNECRAMLTRGEVAGVFWFIATTGTASWNNAALTNDGALTALGARWIDLK